MNPAHWPGGLAYIVVFIAAILEGEVIFVTASVLVGKGELHPLGVLVAGALGGSVGDQFWYYALRGRLHRWLERFPRIARHQRAVVARVQRHSTMMTLGCRFLPGLRVAIPAACAYGGVPRLKFTTLNLISAFCWAGSIMSVVAWGGPSAMAWIGLKGWWAVVVPAVTMILFFRWLGRMSTELEDKNTGSARQETGNGER
ncbi:MAG TPA: DedA family protein [Vicinamibacterales bacterium]